MSDTSRFCIDCGRKFIWSQDQQRYYRERRWNPPKRCLDCRSRRRCERQSRMHNLVDLQAAPHVPGGWRLADPPVCAPSPVPRWCDLSRSAHYRHLSKFVHMDPKAMTSLGVPEFALLMQWIFEQQDLETKRLTKRDGRLDLELTHRERHWDEFARFYVEGYEIPIDLLLDLSEKLKNTQVKRVHVCTVGTFTATQKRTRHQFPLFLDILEGEDLQRWLREAQRRCRERLARQRGTPSFPPTAWTRRLTQP